MSYKIGLSAVNIPDASHVYVEDALLTGRIAHNEYIERFEFELARFVGAKYAIATSSGTMADTVALRALFLLLGHKKVLCPALTFIAQPNAARMAGMEVVFCDVREDWIINRPDVIEDCIFYPSDCMGRLAETLTDGRKFSGLEDACEAFGSEYNGRKAGTFGELGTFSFFISHTLTTGEGGAIVTDDETLANICRMLRSHGRVSETDPFNKFHFNHFGFNAKMSGLTAALALGVVEHAGEYVARRRASFELLNELMDYRIQERSGEKIIPHGYPLEFTSETARDAAMNSLLMAGIECRKFFSCLPTMEPAYAYLGKTLGDYPVAEHIAHTHLYIPCHQNLNESDVRYMAEVAANLEGLM